MLLGMILCAVVASSRGQEQSLCLKLHGFYETICSNGDEEVRGVAFAHQGPTGKRGIPGEKGEMGSPGLPGLEGKPGDVDYDRVDEMVIRKIHQGSSSTFQLFHIVVETQQW